MPYIVASTLLLPWLFLLYWTPPHAKESLWNLAYLAVITIAFNVVYEFHQIPFEALLPELIPEEKQRVNVSGWRSGFQLLGTMAGAAVGPLVEKLGYGQTMTIFAIGALPFLYIPLLFLRERSQTRAQQPAAFSFWKSLRLTIANRPFQIYTLAWACSWMSSTLIIESMPYIVTEVCGLSEGDTIYFYLPALFVSLACFPLITWLAKRYGKNRMYQLTLLAGALALPGLFLIGKWIPLPLAVQGVAWTILESIAFSGTLVLPGAIAAEITDLDAQQTGQRREGSFYAIWGLLDQFASGLALFILPLLLLLGRSASAPRGPLGVRLLGLVGGALMLAGFMIFRRYPGRAKQNS